MDNSPIMFKGAINGFDKKAVISYIFELNEANQAAQTKLSEQLEDAVEARENAERRLAELEKKTPRIQGELSNLEAELSGERERAAELSEMVDNLNTEVEHLREELARKEAEAADTTLADEAEEKMRRLEAEKDQLAQKEKEVERASAQIGRLLLDATADADSIREKARAESDRLLEQARAEAAEILRAATADSEAAAAAARVKADSILAEATANLEEAHRRFGSFRQDIDSIRRTILDAADAMKGKAEAVGSVVDALEVKMNAGLDEQVEPGTFPRPKTEKTDLFRFPSH